MDPALLQPLLNLGGVGVVLAWFMLRFDARMTEMSGAINNMSKAVLLDLASRPGISPAIREQAQKLVEELLPAVLKAAASAGLSPPNTLNTMNQSTKEPGAH